MTHANRYASRPGGQGSRRLVVGAVLSVGLVAAACGSSPSSAVANKTSTSKASAATVPDTTVRSVSNAMLGMILVSPTGATLYRFTADLNGQSTCTGACAQLWPPFTVAAGSQPTGGNGLVGVFSTSKRADGTTQVTYNGAPLYTFSGDKTAGSTTGQGVLGKWFVVNVSATPAAAPTAPAATTAPAAGSTTPTSQAPATPAVTPATPAQPPAAPTPAPTSPPPTAPPVTSPPPTSPPTTAPPPPTTTPTTMGYGY